MQTILTFLTMLFAGILLNAENKVEVQTTGFENNTGNAMIALYYSEEILKMEINL